MLKFELLCRFLGVGDVESRTIATNEHHPIAAIVLSVSGIQNILVTKDV